MLVIVVAHIHHIWVEVLVDSLTWKIIGQHLVPQKLIFMEETLKSDLTQVIWVPCLKNMCLHQ